jgi:death on curing protein
VNARGKSPKWINLQALLFLHEESLAQFGGPRGLRDAGLLESALARPQNRLLYEPDASLFQLAAAYCFGVAKNHPFVDGNKRAAFLAATLFLTINGLQLEADPMEAAEVVLQVASSARDEDTLALWFSGHCSSV